MRIISLLFVLLGLSVAAPLSAEEAPKVGANEVVLKVNGIVCPACAQGIIRKVSKLGFVDTTKLNSGVELDVENHRARIALKQGVKPDMAALFEAIRKGGFDPVGVYIASGKYLTADQAVAKAE